MKILGIILVVLGVLMFIFGAVTFTHKEKVVDAGPLEINKKEKHTIAWPNYAGGLSVLAGVFVLLAAGKKKA